MDMQRLIILRRLPEALKAFRSDKDFEDRLTEALRGHLGATAGDAFWYRDRGTIDGRAFVIYCFDKAEPGAAGGVYKMVGDECLYRVPYAVAPGGVMEFTFGEPERVRERRDYVPEGEALKAGPLANRPGLVLDPTTHRWKHVEGAAPPAAPPASFKLTSDSNKMLKKDGGGEAAAKWMQHGASNPVAFHHAEAARHREAAAALEHPGGHMHALHEMHTRAASTHDIAAKMHEQKDAFAHRWTANALDDSRKVDRPGAQAAVEHQRLSQEHFALQREAAKRGDDAGIDAHEKASALHHKAMLAQQMDSKDAGERTAKAHAASAGLGVSRAEATKAGPIANRPGLTLDPSTHRWKRSEAIAAQHRTGGSAATAAILDAHAAALRSGDRVAAQKAEGVLAKADQKPSDKYLFHQLQLSGGDVEAAASEAKRGTPDLAHAHTPARLRGMAGRAHQVIAEQHRQKASAISDEWERLPHETAAAAHESAAHGWATGHAGAPEAGRIARMHSDAANAVTAESLKAGPLANRPGLTLDPTSHRWKRSGADGPRPGLTFDKSAGQIVRHEEAPTEAAAAAHDHEQAAEVHGAQVSAWVKKSQTWPRRENGQPVNRAEYKKHETWSAKHGEAWAAHRNAMTGHLHGSLSPGESDHAWKVSKDAHDWSAANGFETHKAKSRGDNLTLDMFGGSAPASAAKPAPTSATAAPAKPAPAGDDETHATVRKAQELMEVGHPSPFGQSWAAHSKATIDAAHREAFPHKYGPGDPTHGGHLVAQKVTDKAGHQTTRYKKTGEAAHPLAHLQKLQPGDQTTAGGVRIHASTPIGHGAVPHLYDTEAGRELGPRDDPKTLDKIAEHIKKPRDTIPGTPESIRKMMAAQAQPAKQPGQLGPKVTMPNGETIQRVFVSDPGAAHSASMSEHRARGDEHRRAAIAAEDRGDQDAADAHYAAWNAHDDAASAHGRAAQSATTSTDEAAQARSRSATANAAAQSDKAAAASAIAASADKGAVVAQAPKPATPALTATAAAAPAGSGSTDFDTLHPKSKDAFNAAFASRDAGEMASLLHADNKRLRAEFTRRTSVKLPSTVKGTREAIHQWAAGRPAFADKYEPQAGAEQKTQAAQGAGALHPKTSAPASTPTREYEANAAKHRDKARNHDDLRDTFTRRGDHETARAHAAAKDAHNAAAQAWGKAGRSPSQEAESAAHYAADDAEKATNAVGDVRKAANVAATRAGLDKHRKALDELHGALARVPHREMIDSLMGKRRLHSHVENASYQEGVRDRVQKRVDAGENVDPYDIEKHLSGIKDATEWAKSKHGLPPNPQQDGMAQMWLKDNGHENLAGPRKTSTAPGKPAGK